MQAAKRQSAAIGSISVAIAAQGVLILTGVFVARLLGVQDRGHFQMLVVLPAMFNHIGTFGLPAALTYYIARNGGAGGRELLGSLAKPLIGLAAVLSLIHATILFLLLRGEDGRLIAAGGLTLAAVPGLIALGFGLALFQGQQRFREFNLLRAMQLVTYALGLGVLFLSGQASLVLVALVWTTSAIVSGAYVLIRALRGSTRNENTSIPTRRNLAWFGMRSIVGSTSPFEALRLDHLIVGLVVGPAALGLYVVGQAFTNLPKFIAQSVGMVAYPKIAASPHAARGQILTYFSLALIVCCSIVAFLEVSASTLVPFFFGNEFSAAAPLMQILLLSGLLFGLRRVLADCARGLGLPELGTIAEVSGWLALVPSVALLANQGAEGIAWSMVIAAATGFIVITVLISRAMARTPASKRALVGPAGEKVVADAA